MTTQNQVMSRKSEAEMKQYAEGCSNRLSRPSGSLNSTIEGPKRDEKDGRRWVPIVAERDAGSVWSKTKEQTTKAEACKAKLTLTFDSHKSAPMLLARRSNKSDSVKICIRHWERLAHRNLSLEHPLPNTLFHYIHIPHWTV